VRWNGTLVRVRIHAVRKPNTSAMNVAAKVTISVLSMISQYFPERPEVGEAVRFRRAHLGRADIERRLQQVEDRIEDEQPGHDDDHRHGYHLGRHRASRPGRRARERC
jgi:hypothetical protein